MAFTCLPSITSSKIAPSALWPTAVRGLSPLSGLSTFSPFKTSRAVAHRLARFELFGGGRIHPADVEDIVFIHSRRPVVLAARISRLSLAYYNAEVFRLAGAPGSSKPPPFTPPMALFSIISSASARAQTSLRYLRKLCSGPDYHSFLVLASLYPKSQYPSSKAEIPCLSLPL